MNIPAEQPEVPRPFQSTPDVQYTSLRRLVQATAVSVLILTGTVFIYLYRQVVLVRRQTAELVRYVAEVDRAGMPEFVDKVRASFNDYRKTHPDFNPIYVRFFGTNEPPGARKISPAPGLAPNTVSNPPEKK
jgi:hypothetical protein